MEIILGLLALTFLIRRETPEHNLRYHFEPKDRVRLNEDGILVLDPYSPVSAYELSIAMGTAASIDMNKEEIAKRIKAMIDKGVITITQANQLRTKIGLPVFLTPAEVYELEMRTRGLIPGETYADNPDFNQFFIDADQVAENADRVALEFNDDRIVVLPDGTRSARPVVRRY